ncbi:MAG: hypothetical protein CSA81_09595 [Acidobacteria bacterium]|nr:MAG: hypothetical protein CSA81_09595 [Acidobacteriota bacterium]
MRSRLVVLWGITTAALFLDWLGKEWALGITGGMLKIVPHFIEINTLRNKGIIFGWGSDLDPLHLIVIRVCTILLLFALVIAVSRLKWSVLEPIRSRYKLQAGLLLILAGGTSNALESLLRGFVTDYISLFRLPVINLSDILILAGCVMILITIFRTEYASHTV